jgi:endonuclease/exonuclease/phosphatase family metal-dependent hydrolase
MSSFAEEMKLLTWNVFMLPKPINFSKQVERTHLIAAELKNTDYDIIVLQEAFIARFRNTVANELKGKYPFTAHLPKSRRLFHFINSGLFILSRHPFEILNHHYYNHCTHSDCFSSKGALLIELTMPSGKKVQVATSHLQAWDDKKAVEVRKQQIDELNDLLKTYARPGVPQILSGDMNIDGKIDLEYPGALKVLGMTSVPLQGTLDYSNSFPVDCYKIPGSPDAAPQWLDHVWLKTNESETEVVSKNVRPFMGTFGDKQCSLSDHYSVEAVLKL